MLMVMLRNAISNYDWMLMVMLRNAISNYDWMLMHHRGTINASGVIILSMMRKKM